MSVITLINIPTHYNFLRVYGRLSMIRDCQFDNKKKENNNNKKEPLFI